MGIWKSEKGEAAGIWRSLRLAGGGGGEPPVSGHRYWRLYNIQGNSNDGDGTGSVGSREIELREAVGGADVTGSGTASSSASWYAPSTAFDNDNSTGWWANSTTGPHWLKYDFGAGNAKNIVEVVVGASQVSAPACIAAFELQWSDDDSTWTTAMSINDYGDWGYVTSKTYNASMTPGGNVSKKAWRINVSAINSSEPIIVLREVEMRTVAGGTDQCTGGRSLQSSQINDLYGSSKAFDDNTGLQWYGGVQGGSWPTVGEWIGYEFSEAKEIVEVAITAEFTANAPKDFTVEYWNGSAWVVAMTLSNITGWINGQTRYFNASGEVPLPHRYWRVNISAVQVGSYAQLAEVGLRTSVGGASVATGGTASASSYFNGNESLSPSKAFDGDINTYWFSDPSLPAWIKYDFGAGNEKTIVQVALTARNEGVDNAQADPKDFTIQYSDDDTTWTTVYTATGVTWGTDPETKVYSF